MTANIVYCKSKDFNSALMLSSIKSRAALMYWGGSFICGSLTLSFFFSPAFPFGRGENPIPVTLPQISFS